MARTKKDTTGPQGSTAVTPGRRGSTALTPAKPRKQRFAQLRRIGEVYRQSKAIDPSITWWMLGTFLLVELVLILIGLAIGHPIYLGIVGLPLALLAAAVVMARRAESAAYRQLEGQAGGGGAALGALRRGWYYDQQPVAVEATRPGDVAGAAMVFRAIGRPGVVLVCEGPVGRAQRLGESERKRITRVLPSVPVHVLRVGSAVGEVPVRKLAGKIQRMKPALTKAEVSAVNKRLKALGAPKPPVPKGIDPSRARPDRKGARGR